MESSIEYNDDENIEIRLTKTQCLEMAYQETLRNADVIIKEEAARRLRLRILMLENENDELHEQLALGDDRIDILEQEAEDLRTQLSQAQEDVSRQEAELRIQSRDLGNMKAELSSMCGITSDSAKLLTEKLSLARELATLKPELEHLRSQASYQQTVLAEKLALERQVSTLEVELETEKRAASKRAAQKNQNYEREAELQSQIDALQKDLAKEKREREKARKETEAELQSQIDELQKNLSREKRERDKAHKEAESEFQSHVEDLQKDLAKEKREREKARKDAEKDIKTAETKEALLESKLDQFRTKLRSTKEQLKECQTELAQARAAAVKVASSKPQGDGPAKTSRKRTAMEMTTDLTMGTPDGVVSRGKRPGVKRGRMDQTMVGEKSMFSITPFLNRTVNMAPDTPSKESEAEIEEEKQRPTEAATIPEAEPEVVPAAPKPAEKPAPKPRGRRKAAEKEDGNVLGEAKTSAKNKKIPPKKSRPMGQLEMVTEEGDENEEPVAAVVAPTPEPVGAPGKVNHAKITKVQLKPTDTEEPKKKKRKLLGGGKTLFDEDDAEATKRPAKVNLGAPRLLAKAGLAGPKGGLKGVLGAESGFAAFSPLKKDRRGVGASFLA